MIKIFAKHVGDEIFNMKKDEEDLMEDFDGMVPYEWAFDDISALQYLLQCVI